MAAVPGRGMRPVRHRRRDLQVHRSSSCSPVLTCGDFVLVAGQTAEALDPAQGPIDPSARLPAFTFPKKNRTGCVQSGRVVFLSGHGLDLPKLPAVRQTGNPGADMTVEEGYATARSGAHHVGDAEGALRRP